MKPDEQSLWEAAKAAHRADPEGYVNLLDLGAAIGIPEKRIAAIGRKWSRLRRWDQFYTFTGTLRVWHPSESWYEQNPWAHRDACHCIECEGKAAPQNTASA